MRFRQRQSARLVGTFMGLLTASLTSRLIPAAGAPPADQAGQGSILVQRIIDQRAIEKFYWDRRTWPAQNPGQKPTFDPSALDGPIWRKVQKGLLETEALHRYWSVNIGRTDLQRELDRMARDTRDAAGLQELWRALGNDPQRIGESLARPLIADRLLRVRYAWDLRFHAGVEARAREALASSSACEDSGSLRARSTLECWRSKGGEYRETLIERDPPASQPASEMPSAPAWRESILQLARAFKAKSSGAERTVGPERGPWSERRVGRTLVEAEPEDVLGGIPRGQWSSLIEEPLRFHAVRVLERSPGRVRVATVSWEKRPFDDWWASVRDSLSYRLVEPASGLVLPTNLLGSQPVDTWLPMDPDGPLARNSHSAVWTGSEMIVWGGEEAQDLGDGARYDPATDTWTAISSLGAPAPRAYHSAFWTGTEMLVWGGFSQTLSDSPLPPGPGARYDPEADTWTPISDLGAPNGRSDYSVVWTGIDLIVWGGSDDSGFLNSGARYHLSTDTWSPINSTGAPNARALHTAVWSGSLMIVWGGENDTGFLASGGRYNPTADTWANTRLAGAPTGRVGHTATWTGTKMLIWGGTDDDGYTNTGARYSPQNDHWDPVTTSRAPSPRKDHTAVWSGNRVIVWGGTDEAGLLGTGGRYDPSANAWQSISTTGAPSARNLHTAIWAGSRMIVWGGNDFWSPVDSGGRYDPLSDNWLPTLDPSDRPTGRDGQASVWTGGELIVWGGDYFAPIGGGRYDPVTDDWTPTNSIGEPDYRIHHTSIWTGTDLIVWGGEQYDPASTGARVALGGGRYDPAADEWSPTNAVGEPEPRSRHTAVWTGTEMIVWGGFTFTSTPVSGGRYDPTTDHWVPTAVAGAPGGRELHTAVWTGTEMIVWGGQSAPGTPRSGARYRPNPDVWRPISDIGVTGRVGHSAVWTGKEMIVWGGNDDEGLENTGDRYDPIADAWRPIATAGAPPLGLNSSAIWACGHMLAWGPADSTFSGGGGARYDPANNSWTALSSAGAPFGFYAFSLAASETAIFLFSGAGALGTVTQTGGIYEACLQVQPLGPASGLSVAPATEGHRIAWYVEPTATGYDLIRGDLGILHSTHGNFTAAILGCLLFNSKLTWFDDPVTPEAGQGLWYLSRARRTLELGTYDEGEPSQVAPRDAEIAASGLACP